MHRTATQQRTLFARGTRWCAAALLLAVSAASSAASSLAVHGSLLSAGLTEALTSLGAAVDQGPPINSGGGNVTPSGFAGAPRLWTLTLQGAAGDTGQPDVLFDNGANPLPVVTVVTRAADTRPSRIAFEWRTTVNQSPPAFRLELGSGDDTQALGPGNYAGATATFTPGTPLLDIVYAVDHCNAAERGFDVEALDMDGDRLVHARVRFHCGSRFSGVFEYQDIAALDGDVVRIQGTVWEDQDMDGERQGNGTTGPDTSLAGIDVDLLRDGRRVMHTTTDSHGVFVFDATYDSYRVAVRPPRGYVAAPRAGGAGDNLHSALDPATATSDVIAPGTATFDYVGGGHRADPPAISAGLGYPGGRPRLPLAASRVAHPQVGDRASYRTYDGKAERYATDTVRGTGTIVDGSPLLDVVDQNDNHLWLTGDPHGLRLHRAQIKLANGTVVGFGFAPALVLLPATLDVTAHTSAGRVTVQRAGRAAVTVRYDYHALFRAGYSNYQTALAAVTGPRGTEPGVNVENTLAFTGLVHGTTLTQRTAALDVWGIDHGLLLSRVAGSKREHTLDFLRNGLGDSADNDRASDILALDGAGGNAGVWHMHGGAAPTWQALTNAANANMLAAVFGDVDGDGQADVVTHDMESGLVSVSSGDAPPRPLAFAPRRARLLGTADLSHDGRRALVWRDVDTTAIARWSLATPGQVNVAGLFVVGGADDLRAPATWSLLGTRDSDGDGADDLTWYDPARRAVVTWFMNGPIRRQVTTTPVSAPWQPVAVNEFSGDGRARLLWFNPLTREVRVTLPSGGAAPRGVLLGKAETGTHMVASGDFDGDGTADVLWGDDGTKALSTWLLRGNGVRARAALGTLPAGFLPQR